MAASGRFISMIRADISPKPYGAQSMIAPLRKVMVRRPDSSFVVGDPSRWHYSGQPELAVAQEEHDALVSLLRSYGADVVYHDACLPDMADSIYVFDPAIITDEGAVVLRMGKELRRGEEDAMERKLLTLGVPILGRLHGAARAEGGDLLWLDEHTLIAGVSFRTNLEGVKQLNQILRPLDVEVISVDLPYWRGPEVCLHLLSLISLVTDNLAVIHSTLLPVRCCTELQRRGFSWVEVPEEEFLTMGPNILALEPGRCLVLEGNPITKERLEQAGCRVLTYKGDEISHRAEGGPTCLTRPIWRQSCN
jgi:N-dimethylarginine dimethylaminohydrolase